MKIAVTMRTLVDPDHGEVRDGISREWTALLHHFGCVPVLVPNYLPDPAGFVKRNRCRAILLTNGEDVELGQHGKSRTGTNRDLTEAALADLALADGLPILGVCRGMQFLNVFFGGTLENVQNHAGTEHDITVQGKFADLLGADRVVVNSYHNQAVTMSCLSSVLKPFAFCEEVIEGLHLPGVRVTGIQWHPERDENPDRFMDLFRHCLGEEE